jgi:hypothetical protein
VHPLFLVLLLAAPAPAPGVTAPAVRRAYPVPYRLTDTRHILVRARLNGAGPFNFIVDTGAPALYLAPEAAQRAQVPSTSNNWSQVDRIEIEGGALLESIRARIEEPAQIKGMNAMGVAGVRLDGVFGYEVLARFRIEVDLTEASMRWTPVEAPLVPLVPSSDATGGAPPKAVASIDALAQLAATLLPRRPEPELVPRGFVGVELGDSRQGVRVQAVLAGSPAAKAGLRPGDRFVRIGIGGTVPKPVRTAAEAIRLASVAIPGDPVRLTLLRGGRTLRLQVVASRGGM